MHVRITGAGCLQRLPSGAIQSFPVDWSGDVADHVGVAFVEAGLAVEVGTAEPTLSPQQVQVLANAADQIIAEAEAIAAPANEPEMGQKPAPGRKRDKPAR